jgi:hypothetical protein
MPYGTLLLITLSLVSSSLGSHFFLSLRYRNIFGAAGGKNRPELTSINWQDARRIHKWDETAGLSDGKFAHKNNKLVKHQ